MRFLPVFEPVGSAPRNDVQSPANSETRNAATWSQSFAAASKSASIAWTVLGVSTRASTLVVFKSGI